MSINKTTVAFFVAVGAAVAPISFGAGPSDQPSIAGVIRLAEVCASEELAVEGRGCTADPNSICETVRADYVGYKNN